ncbi:MAG TPA: hypothetical protein VFQ44_17255 [Streptosporangiaceae bacterium]|nr:hypothetical protein [Streptosporangiaceae bacterium]
MLTYVKSFWVPKRGNSPDEYEDAFWIGPDGDSDGELAGRVLRVSLADGASESLLAGRWAKRLVACFGTTQSAASAQGGFLRAYETAASQWDAELARYKAERDSRGVPIQWYEEPGLVKGAYATILAVEFREDAEGGTPAWSASCLGDSCLFQVRDESLYASFPLSDAADFSIQPPLLASRQADSEVLLRHVVLTASDWERGDSFYLATDALAAWFLSEVERDGRPWETLRDLDTSDAPLEFPDWIDQLRDQGGLRNDDTTLVRIDLL